MRPGRRSRSSSFTLVGQAVGDQRRALRGVQPRHLLVRSENQPEIDRLWDALSAGGTVEQCGWLRDRYGVSWQIAPAVLGEMMKAPDRSRARRVMEAMLQMQKLDLARLAQAYGTPTASTGAEARP